MGLLNRFKKKPEGKSGADNSPANENGRGFRFLDKLVHSGSKRVVLDCDIELMSGRLIKEEKIYSAGIRLDVDNLVIDGNGHAIDAKGQSRIFTVTGKNVTIRNITLKNGYAQPDPGRNVVGGAINIGDGGSLNIHNSVLSNNVANNGGAVFNAGELTIEDSTFSNNHAKEGNGGAICFSLGVLNVVESTFSNNIAESQGGAIYITNGDFDIQKSTFSDNRAESGGAICDWGRITYIPATVIYDDVFNIAGSVFINNAAESEGGAINARDKLNLSDSKLIGNSSSEGGAIYSYGHNKVFNCEIFNNKSQDNIIQNEDSLQIYDTKFRDNQSNNVLYNKEKLSIFGCEFSDNRVEESVIYNRGENCTIERGTFEDNLSNEDSKNIINRSELTLISPKIKDDSQNVLNDNHIFIKELSPKLLSRIYGDGMVEVKTDWIPDKVKFDFGYLDKIIRKSPTNEIILKEDICFEDYEKEFYEGGIELDIDNLVIDGNGKTIDGAGKSRIFIVTGKNVVLKNITFKNGHSHKNYDNQLNNHGGALRVIQGADLTITNCNFIDNRSEEYGSAIYNSGVLNIFESEISNHEAWGHGGAIYNSYGILNISKSVLSHNSANSHGGAIFNMCGNLNISKSTLSDNTASGSALFGSVGLGGAIYSKEGILSISESSLSSNFAEQNGAAIYNNEGDLVILQSEFSENENGSAYTGAICTCEKGLKKVFNFITNEIGPRDISNRKYFNADEIKDSSLKYVEIKRCTFKGNSEYDISYETIDAESEYLKNYDLNDILGFEYS